MSIATELTRIQQAKADIKTAIEAKGVTVPSSATIDTYDDYVSQISGGGGGGSSADTEALKGIIDRSLTAITIPSGVTTIGNGAFQFCTSLTNIDIPDSVTSIGSEAFRNCSGLTSVDFPSGITSISGSAFSNCYSLTSVDFPSGITSISGSAFQYCNSLTAITCNATIPPTLGSSVFASTNNCPIYVPSGSVDTYKAASGWSAYASRIQAIPSPTPTGDTWVVYHAGDTIPAGQYGGVRISSATSIDNGAIDFFLNTDYTFSNYIELGNNIVCTASECMEYCCNQYECVEWDEETGECIEETCYDWSDECCGMEECTDWADGYIMYVNDVETAEEFSFTDGYWTFDSYDLYVESSMQAPFDIELLVTQ